MNLSYNDNENIFDLKVDEEAKSYMLETARWGKFLAIVGFIMLGLMLLGFVFMGSAISTLPTSNGMGAMAALGTVGMILYILVVIAIAFYPIYALLKFSTLLKPALLTGNREQFNRAFGYLKSMFKYYGILVIIVLALYALLFIFAILGGAMSSM